MKSNARSNVLMDDYSFSTADNIIIYSIFLFICIFYYLLFICIFYYLLFIFLLNVFYYLMFFYYLWFYLIVFIAYVNNQIKIKLKTLPDIFHLLL